MRAFLLSALLSLTAFTSVLHGQQVATCHDAQACRSLALEAAARGDYETFHDLAWRAVQTGPKNDPALMYLLARAQVLSGRPHDALVMVQRLAGMGVATDAATNPEFERTRQLSGWPEVAAAIARVESTTAVPAPATAPSRPAAAPRAAAAPGFPVKEPAPRRSTPPTAAVSATPEPGVVVPPAVLPFPLKPAPASEAVRFSAPQLSAAGLAYDVVSHRFVIGDAAARKLIVVGIGAGHADDMVRADSAGFDLVVGLDIDEKRGDLWVASTTAADDGSALHRLQLVSGRPLKTYRAAPALGPTRLIALAIQPSGDVIALDAAGSRLLALARGSSEMTVAMALKLPGATSIAAADEKVFYVAHDDGLARVDVRDRTVTALAAPRGFSLRGFDAIRVYGRALIGLQRTPAGSRQLVRLNLNANGRTVREGMVIDPEVAATDGVVSLTIEGDDLYYLTAESAAPSTSAAAATTSAQLVVRRLTLR